MGAPLTARYADYVITIGDGGKVSVEKGGAPCPSAMGALREIAAATGFTIDPKWNTQGCGKKLVTFLNSGSAAPQAPASTAQAETAPAPKPAPAPTPAAAPTPKPKPETPATAKGADRKTGAPAPSDTITLTPEEMDRILRRLDELEARLNKLSAAGPATHAAPASDGKVTVVKTLYVPTFSIPARDSEGKKIDHKYIYSRGWKDVMVTSDGRFLMRYGSSLRTGINCDSTPISIIREIAQGLGMEVSSDAKKMTLVMQIINQFGQIVNGLYIQGDGEIYNYQDFCFEEYIGALTNQDLIAHEYTNEAMKINPQWSKEELLHEIIRYIGSLSTKYGD